MHTSTPDRAVSATTRVYQHLKQGILEQVYGSGVLITEAELAEAVGVSRTPVREALLRLETEGLLTLYPKRGALILPVSAQEIEDVIDARRLVESHAAERVWPIREALADRLEPLCDAMLRARDARDVVAFMTADRDFHATVVSAAGNRILEDLYGRLRDRQMRMGVTAMRLAPHRLDESLGQHTDLVAILREGSPEDGAATWLRMVVDHVGTAAGYLRRMG
jgi:DNA-binding GntR family transcriptional regulator